MLRLRLAPITFALFSLTACHPGFFPARTIEMGDAVQLRVRERGKIGDTGTRFRVDSILDSRCPGGVTCIQAGTVEVWLTINDEGIDRPNGVLMLRDLNAWANVDARYRLELLDVQPLPERGTGGEAKIATIGVGPRSSSR